MSAAPVVLQQALFTSLQAGENEGYQIAGHSAGVDAATRRELSTWGPSHDSLQSGGSEAGSVNWHRLSDGRQCLSLTRATSGEYSGRGAKIETSLVIAGSDAVTLCGHHPLRLLEAAMAAGWTTSPVTEEMMLVGRSQPVQLEAVSKACGIFPVPALAALVERLQQDEPLAVFLERDHRLLIDALFSLLPVEARPLASFTTNLLPSAKRAFRLHLLTQQAELKHLFIRVTGGKLLDLNDSQTQPATEQGGRLAELLAAQKWSDARRLVLGE